MSYAHKAAGQRMREDGGFIEREAEMRKMRYTLGYTMQQIADTYGVSRERVRQIVGNSPDIRKILSEGFVPDASKTAQENMNAALRALGKPCKRAIRRVVASTHHAIKGGRAEEGEAGEQETYAWLRGNGIENQLMPLGHEYDILVGDIRIDVKSTSKMWKPPRNKTGYYVFRIRKNEKDECDFFVCHVMGTTHYWIIPSTVLPAVEKIYIAFPKSARAWKNSADYSEFYNRLDLLGPK